MINKTAAKLGLGAVFTTSVVTPSLMAHSKGIEINKLIKEKQTLEKTQSQDESKDNPNNK